MARVTVEDCVDKIPNRFELVLTQYDYAGWASLEWECCLKHADDGAREGAQFIRDHIIRVQSREFDAGMKGQGSTARNRNILGLG